MHAVIRARAYALLFAASSDSRSAAMRSGTASGVSGASGALIVLPFFFCLTSFSSRSLWQSS